MNLLAHLRRMWRGTTAAAEQAATLPPIPGPVVHPEKPSRTECRPANRCETCRRLNLGER